MAKDTVEIPVPVLSSIETLDELQDWLTAQTPQIVAELRDVRRQDLAGEFKAWEPRQCSSLVACSPKDESAVAVTRLFLDNLGTEEAIDQIRRQQRLHGNRVAAHHRSALHDGEHQSNRAERGAASWIE
jgi:hypothetical protein